MDETRKDHEPDSSPVFEVRHVVVEPASQIPAVLQYVRAALDTVGHGSAYATPTGLQITAPVELILHLRSTIEGYKTIDLSDVLAFDRKLYRPGVIVADNRDSSAVDVAIRQLNLCPRDMSFTIAPYQDTKVVLFSGPIGREAFYKAKVVPSIEALVAANPP